MSMEGRANRDEDYLETRSQLEILSKKLEFVEKEKNELLKDNDELRKKNKFFENVG